MTEAASKPARPLQVVGGGRTDLESELEGIAKGAALYYRTLIEQGIPRPIAKTMLLEWHAGYMGRDGES